MPAKKVPVAAAAAAVPVPSVYPLKAGLIDIGVNLTDNMYKGFYNFSSKRSHDEDIDLVVDRAEAMGVVGLIITGGNLEESQHAVELAIAQNRRLRAKRRRSGGEEVATTHIDTNASVATGNSATSTNTTSSTSGNSASSELKCYATVGCHPTRTVEMKENQKAYLDGLRVIISKHSVRNLEKRGSNNKPHTAGDSKDGEDEDDACVVVAIGECGLDYDRLHFTDKKQQLVGFEAQFALADEFRLPMFLHDRNTGEDFKNMMTKHADVLKRCGGGVVHSFTGSLEHLDSLLSLDLYIGINGCSMKTSENLEVVKKVPLNRLMLETDGPWCEIKRTHDSYSLLAGSPADLQMNALFQICKKEKFAMGSLVKSRYEPVQMIEVLEVVYQLRKDEAEISGDREKLASIVRKNTEAVFPLH